MSAVPADQDRQSDASIPVPGGGVVAVVVGAPGSGKSTVGRVLADRLGVPFWDVDEVIEERAGKPIGEIFTDDGEPAFRALEEAATAELLGGSGIVSLGGGAVLSSRTRDLLAGHRVIWLAVTAAEAARRVGLTEARPLLLGNVRGRLVRLLAERTPLYEQVATLRMETDGRAPAEVVDQILGLIR